MGSRTVQDVGSVELVCPVRWDKIVHKVLGWQGELSSQYGSLLFV